MIAITRMKGTLSYVIGLNSQPETHTYKLDFRRYSVPNAAKANMSALSDLSCVHCDLRLIKTLQNVACSHNYDQVEERQPLSNLA